MDETIEIEHLRRLVRAANDRVAELERQSIVVVDDTADLPATTEHQTRAAHALLELAAEYVDDGQVHGDYSALVEAVRVWRSVGAPFPLRLWSDDAEPTEPWERAYLDQCDRWIAGTRPLLAASEVLGVALRQGGPSHPSQWWTDRGCVTVCDSSPARYHVHRDGRPMAEHECAESALRCLLSD